MNERTVSEDLFRQQLDATGRLTTVVADLTGTLKSVADTQVQNNQLMTRLTDRTDEGRSQAVDEVKEHVTQKADEVKEHLAAAIAAAVKSATPSPVVGWVLAGAASIIAAALGALAIISAAALQAPR